MSDERKSMLAAGAAYCIFGLSYLFSKMALNITEPMILLCVRFSVTFIVLNILVCSRVLKLHLKGKNLTGPILLGILQPVLYFVFENYGLKYTTTSFTGIVSSISPIFTAIMGVIFLHEKPNFRQWICIGLSIAGVLMVSLGSGGGENTIAGCVCLLIAYLLGSFYSILVRKLSDEFSPVELTYVMFMVGFTFFMAMAFIQHRADTVSMITTALSDIKFIAAVLYLGAAASIAAYMLANYALSRLPVTRATIFNSFSTIISVSSGVILMHDPFTITSAIAFAMILFGVFGVNRFANSETAEITKN
jgi:drug/metabolite transporter (DMT)-like permease